ncbi:MAG: hypothetical protein LQ338_004207 [Usnochroma carphineum]|nr:MAG: hypothetical protein LQ338_004207 [Usnochroma carphineum]
MSTSSFWFVPDEEYFAATEDCAVVNEPASSARRRFFEDIVDFRDDDTLVGEQEYRTTFNDEINDPLSYGDCYGFGVDIQLLYADVDRNDPGHKEIGKRAAKEGLREEDKEETEDVSEKLISNMLKCLHFREEVDDGTKLSKEERRTKIIEYLRIPHVGLSARRVDYILGTKSEEERRELLSVFSGQYRRRTQRPVVLLVGMIDKYSTEELGSKEGWAVAYNFYDNHLVIKPFFADVNHHPLAEKWDMELPDDGISFRGRPSAFVAKLLQLHEDLENKAHDENPIAYGYRMLAYYHVAWWVVEHWEALAEIKQVEGEAPMTDQQRTQVKDLMKLMLKVSANIEFPYKKQKPAERKSITSFKHLQVDLENLEDAIRSEAIEAKEAGNEAAANNAAKFYTKLLEQLQSFNMDPEKEG